MISSRTTNSLSDSIVGICDEKGNVLCKMSSGERRDITNAILKILSDKKVSGYFAKEILEEVRLTFEYTSTISI